MALLASVDKAAANCLKRLLDMKTRVGYGATSASLTDQKRAGRTADALVQAAERA